MAASVYGTIRLDNNLTGILPTATYKVRADAWKDSNQAMITVDYAVTGQAHVHRGTDGSGDIVQIKDHIYTLILTQAEYLVLVGLVGKIVYFMPNLRDEADSSYREVVAVESFQDETLLDTAAMTYFLATVTLKHASGCTVDT